MVCSPSAAEATLFSLGNVPAGQPPARWEKCLKNKLSASRETFLLRRIV